jgi:hypothetical protein
LIIIGSDQSIDGIFTGPGSFLSLRLKLAGRKMRVAAGTGIPRMLS